MANFLQDIAYNVVGLIPGVKQIRGERAALQQMYNVQNAAGGLVPKHYYQLVDSGTGNLKGISAVCDCGQEYRMMSLFEIFRLGYKCPVCKSDINVLKYIGAIDASGKFLVKSQEIEPLLLKMLPVRPAGVSGPTQSPYADTWNMDDSGVAWQGKPPLGSDGGWV